MEIGRTAKNHKGLPPRQNIVSRDVTMSRPARSFGSNGGGGASSMERSSCSSTRPPLSPTKPAEQEEVEQQQQQGFEAAAYVATIGGVRILWNNKEGVGPLHSAAFRIGGICHQSRTGFISRGSSTDDNSSIDTYSDIMGDHDDDDDDDDDNDEGDGDLVGLGLLKENLKKALVHVDMGHFQVEPPRALTF